MFRFSPFQPTLTNFIVLHTPRATRFLALQELAIEFRYESPWDAKDYTFRYTKTQGQAAQCNTIFIPLSTRYRDRREITRIFVLLFTSVVTLVVPVYFKIMGLK